MGRPNAGAPGRTGWAVARSTELTRRDFGTMLLIFSIAHLRVWLIEGHLVLPTYRRLILRGIVDEGLEIHLQREIKSFKHEVWNDSVEQVSLFKEPGKTTGPDNHRFF